LSSTPNPVASIPVQVTAANNWQFVFSGVTVTSPVAALQIDPRVTIGPRVLRAYVLPASVNTVALFRSTVAAGSVYAVSPPLIFTALPGGQFVSTLVLPHYSE